MEKAPQDLRYTAEHEWTRVEGDLVRVGITDHAQDRLGDVVFVELPKEGKVLKAGAPFGVVESVKAVSELFAPVSGSVVEANADLDDRPELVNSDPYGAGWMIVIRPTDVADVGRLLTAQAYERLVANE